MANSNKIVRKDERYDNSKFWIEFGIDLEQRRLMLDEDVDEYSIGWIIRGIFKMVEMDGTAPIDVYVNSYGGNCYDGLALFDVLRSLDYLTVRTHALGKVMSMGLKIYLAGDERYSYPSSTFMAHSVSSEIPYEKTYAVKVEAQETNRLNNIMLDILTEKDVSFIFNSWLKSFRKSPLTHNVNSTIYFTEHHKTIEKLLKTNETLVACNEHDPSQIFGYICAGRYQGVFVVHYIYVKHPYRGLGLAKGLFQSFKHDPSVACMYTHRPRS